jgi:hypothetical protein
MQTQKIWILATLAVAAHAQWVNHPTPGTPRTRDGKPNLSAPAPRAANGKPDLSGIWLADGAPIEELRKMLPGGVNGLGEEPPSKYFLNILADFKPEEAPIRPAAAALYRQHAQAGGKDFPVTRCLPMGVPVAETAPDPYKILQTPQVVAFLYEADTTFRQVFTDERKLPDNPQPAWMGYSVGHWAGDALIVEAAGFNDQSWLDASGHTHSEALRVTERFHRRDFGHLELQVTIDDPQTFTGPFSFKVNESLLPDTDVLEYYCVENEKDVKHLAAK